MVFDGRGFAKETEIEIRDRVVKMARKPKLVAVVDPANEAGVKYCQLKAKMAERLGIDFQILNSKSEISNKSQIQKLNNDPGVDGIMMQMPFANSRELINLIDPAKDVDGLREDSPFQPAVVRAIIEVLNSKSEISNKSQITNSQIVVVGAKGFVGRKLMQTIPNAVGMDKDDFDSELLKTADVIISATGQKEIIDGSMVKDGFAAIDVGYPDAEFTSDALAKALFYTPVPGGVGPVTVAMLFANLVDAMLK